MNRIIKAKNLRRGHIMWVEGSKAEILSSMLSPSRVFFTTKYGIDSAPLESDVEVGPVEITNPAHLKDQTRPCTECGAVWVMETLNSGCIIHTSTCAFDAAVRAEIRKDGI